MKRGLSAVSLRGFAQAADGVVQTVLEFDKSVLGPEALLKLLAGDNFTRMLEKSKQNLQRLVVKFDSEALLAQLPR